MIKNLSSILLKVSGEALMSSGHSNIHDHKTLEMIAEDIKEVCNLRIQVCIVVGGGNIYRGLDAVNFGIERTTGDYMGMLATVINSLALQNELEKNGVHTRVQSAIPMIGVSEPFIRKKAISHMQKGRVVIFAAGVGNPFFTTDSAAVLRAIEMKCNYILKGTNIDGVYDKDPHKNTHAKKYKEITHTEILKNNLKVMDMAAIAMAREHKLPIKIFSIKKRGNFARVLQNQGEYTVIRVD